MVSATIDGLWEHFRPEVNKPDKESSILDGETLQLPSRMK